MIKMNLIYICVFHNKGYIDLLKLLITSISVKANIDTNTTDILIVTSPEFQPMIQKELATFDLPLQYYILDLHTMFEAALARLHIFKYDNIHKYDNILYLDTDILVSSDVNTLFNLDISPDKLYALEEGNIGDDNWGGSNFFDFTTIDEQTPAFTCGILLFRNSESIKSLFDSIELHIDTFITNKLKETPNETDYFQFVFGDQPFIVYNAFIQNKYDNQILKQYVQNHPSMLSSDKIIYHFPGNLGNSQSKFDRMTTHWYYLSKRLSDNEYIKYELNNFDYRILNTYKIANNLLRLGPNEDGGYVIADGFDYDLFISCGIADDIRFEDAFLDMHKIQCMAFDATIPSLPPHRNSIEWIQKNIGHYNTDKITNLRDYIAGKNKIFLKMDIEGSEFSWLDCMTGPELENFSQIVLEVHWPFDFRMGDYRMDMLKKLNVTHYIVHIHGNNACGYRHIPKHLNSLKTFDRRIRCKDNIKVPEVLEVTYVNKKLFVNSLVEMKEIQFPTILDYPNNPNAEDIHFSVPVITNTVYDLANISHYHNCSTKKQKVIDDIKQIIIESNELLEGNCFYDNETLILDPQLYFKQINLFWCGKQAKTKICEIGFNTGHSSMLMLLGRDTAELDFTVFDIGRHPYTKPCLEYIKSQFQHIKFEYIEGDSTITMPAWIHENKSCIWSYDLIHVDGGHTEHCISNDMKYADILLKAGGLVIIDDTNHYHINNWVDWYVSTRKYIELDVPNSFEYGYRVLQKTSI